MLDEIQRSAELEQMLNKENKYVPSPPSAAIENKT